MRRVDVRDLAARRQVHDRAVGAHRGGDVPGEIVERDRFVRPDVEDLVPRAGSVDRLGDDGRDIVDVAERPRLRAVAEDRHRAALQQLVHEDPDDVAVPVGDVLARAVDVVRPEHDEVEAEQVVRRPEVQLHGVLRDPVRILRRRPHLLGDRQHRARAVDGDRRGEHEGADAVVDRRVQQGDAAEDVVRVVEPADEVAQALGRVGRQVKDVIEPRRGEQVVHQGGVGDVARHEPGAARHVLPEPAAQVVEHGDVVPAANQRVGDVGPDESGPACD